MMMPYAVEAVADALSVDSERKRKKPLVIPRGHNYFLFCLIISYANIVVADAAEREALNSRP